MTLVTFGFCTAESARPAQVRTTNFVISARNEAIAVRVAQYAEYHRKVKARLWLGRELAPWPEPCAVEARVSFDRDNGPWGATEFDFSDPNTIQQSMTVVGSLDRILDSVLPHEITHTIFATRFRRPLPRWADEGGAVLSEDFEEISRHDLMVREFINSRRTIPLERLFVLSEYPSDMMVLYAQGFSVAKYLVSLKGRPAFLDFVADGQEVGWRHAVQRHYGFRSVQQLEDRWIDWLIAGKGTGADGPAFVADRPPATFSPAFAVHGKTMTGSAPSRQLYQSPRPDPSSRNTMAAPAQIPARPPAIAPRRNLIPSGHPGTRGNPERVDDSPSARQSPASSDRPRQEWINKNSARDARRTGRSLAIPFGRTRRAPSSW